MSAEAGPSPASAAPGAQQLVVPRRRATLLREAAAKAAQNASDGRVAELEVRVRELEQSNGRLHRSAGQLSQTLQEREEQLESALAQVEEAERLCTEVESLRGAMAFELDRADRAGNSGFQGKENHSGGRGGGGEAGRALLLGGPVTPPSIPEALMNAVSPGNRLLLPGPGPSGSNAVGGGTSDQVAELQASSSLLRHVPAEGVRHLLDRAVQLVLAKGDVALAEGQTPPGMLVVLEGSLEVYHFEGDERVTLQIVSAGDILCEMALLTPEPVMSSTVVLKAVRALKIARTDMEEVLRQYPDCVPAVRREAALQIRDALKGGETYRRGTVVTRGSPASSRGRATSFRPTPSPDPKPASSKFQRKISGAVSDPLGSSGSRSVPVVETAGMVVASRDSKYDIAALLRSIPILKSLPEEALRSLVNAVHIKSCISGERVVAEGDVADEAFLVLEGTLQITSTSFHVALGLANHGDVIGEASMLEDGFRTATVTALTDVRLLCIHRDHLGGIFRELPDLRQIMVGLMLRREQENSQKLPRSTFARRKASMMTPTAPIIFEVPVGVGSIPEGDEEEDSDVEELGGVDRTGGWSGQRALQARAAASGRPRPRPSPSPGGQGTGSAGRNISASISLAREVAQGISELGAARGRLQAQVDRLQSEASGNAQSRNRSATEAKSLTQTLRSALQERDAMQARVRGLESEAEETSARAAAAVEEAVALKAQLGSLGQTPGARPGAGAASPEKEKGEASALAGGGSDTTLEELQASYEAAAKREREILLRQRELRSPQRSQFCPTPAGRRHAAAATPGFPQETPSTLGLPEETTRSEGLLSALGSVKRQVSGLTRSALVLQARVGASAAAMPLAPGHPVIVTPGKARAPARTPAGGKPDLSSNLAVIDSLLDNFEVAS